MDVSKNCSVNYLLIRGGCEALYQHNSTSFQHPANFSNQLIPEALHIFNDRQDSTNGCIIKRKLPT